MPASAGYDPLSSLSISVAAATQSIPVSPKLSRVDLSLDDIFHFGQRPSGQNAFSMMKICNHVHSLLRHSHRALCGEPPLFSLAPAIPLAPQKIIVVEIDSHSRGANGLVIGEGRGVGDTDDMGLIWDDGRL